jgi:hypothetical protein
MATSARKRGEQPQAASSEVSAVSLAPAASVVSMRLAIESRETTPRYYVNHAEVNLTPFEMVLTFATLPGRFDAADSERLANGEVITIPSDVQISIPINFVPALIAAMAGVKAEHDRIAILQTSISNESKSNE